MATHDHDLSLFTSVYSASTTFSSPCPPPALPVRPSLLDPSAADAPAPLDAVFLYISSPIFCEALTRFCVAVRIASRSLPSIALRVASISSLILLRRQVLGPDVDDAVRVDGEGDFDLGHAARRGRDAHEVEVAERLVVGRHLPLALQDVDPPRPLAGPGRGEELGLFGRDGRVALDQPGEHAAQRLDAEGQRRDVQQQNVLHLAFQYAALVR